MSDQAPQATPQDDDLSVEELEGAAGGSTLSGVADNTNCSADCNGNCPCGVT